MATFTMKSATAISVTMDFVNGLYEVETDLPFAPEDLDDIALVSTAPVPRTPDGKPLIEQKDWGVMPIKALTLLQGMVKVSPDGNLALTIPKSLEPNWKDTWQPSYLVFYARKSQQPGKDEPTLTEHFSQTRIQRCADICRQITNKWAETNSFNYRVVSSERFESKTLADLGKLYFSVGVGDDLTDLPLLDTLVVFSMITQQTNQKEQFKQNRKKAEREGKKSFNIKYQVKTSFTESEAFSLLSQLQIEFPE